MPRQLPAGPAHFVGRSAELKLLDGLLNRAGSARGTAKISAISGPAGVGKTALALRVAHRAAWRFPDGQLYTDLHGFDAAAAAAPTEVIRGFLDAFEVPAGRIPAGPDAQAGLYRSLLAARQLLIVLDNARDSAQIRPLLPGGTACSVIVTSRMQLTSLVAAQDARPVTLDVLSQAEARELLGRRLGPERLAAELAAADELVSLSARLPLALVIIAARAAVGPACLLTTLASDLREAPSRLDALDTGDPATSPRTMFACSYRNLSDSAARIFRQLAAYPGADISDVAAASLTGVHLDQARAALGELAHASLLDERAPGRFGCHDLLRAYAADLYYGTGTDAGHRACFTTGDELLQVAGED